MPEQTAATERRIVNTDVVNFLLEELSEASYSVTGGNWLHINQLVDSPGVFADFRSWVTCAGAVLESLEFQFGPGTDDSDKGMDHLIYLTDMPARILGVSDDAIDEMQGLPIGKLKEKLSALLVKQQAA